MAFTGILGTIDARLGSFALATVPVGGTPPDFDQDVPQDLTLTQTLSVVKTLNKSVSQTLTLTQVGQKTPGLPAIVGYSGSQTRYSYVYDIDGDQELYKLNEDTVFNYPASCTKLMTLLLLFEYHGSGLSSTVTVTSADLSIFGGASVAGLQNGDVLTWLELAYAIVVPSGGDACQTAARIIGTEIYVAAGSTGATGMTRFIQRMNARAAELGMTNTFYYDSWGESTISGTVRNSITARDLATLLAQCIQNTDLCTVIGTATYSKTFTTPNSHVCNWSNVNRFVNGPTGNQSGIKDDNVIGGKVGEWNGDGVHVNLANAWTAPNGNRIISVVMNAPDYQTLTWDHQGLMYDAIIDWPHLVVGTDEGFDTNLSKVTILASGNGSTILDEGPLGHTPTLSGATRGGPLLVGSTGSIVLGNNDYVSFPDGSDVTVATDDATIEVWYKAPLNHNPATEQLFFLKILEWAMNWYPTALQIFASTNGTGYSNQILTAATSDQTRTFFNGATRHVAWVKQGSTIAGYINGERFTNTITGMSSIANTTDPVRIGGNGSANSAQGKLADFRFTRQLARYTANKVTLKPYIFPRSSVAATPSSNSLTISQSATLTRDAVRSVSQSLTIVDAARKVTDESVPQTLTLTQTLAFEKFKAAAGTSILVPTHTVAVEKTFSRDVQQGLPFTHLAGRSIYRVLSVANTLAASQLAVGIVTKRTNSTLTLTQLAAAVVGKIARNELSIGQTLAREVDFHRNTADNFIPFQILTANATYRRSLSDSLALSQTLVAYLVKSAHNSLSFTQAVTAITVKPAINILPIAHVANVSRNISMDAEHIVPLVQTLQLSKGKSVSVVHAFGMNQFARGTRRLTVTAANALALAHELVREYKYGVVTQTIDLDDTAIVSKLALRDASSILVLADTVHVAKTLVRSIVDTLSFHSSFEKYVGIGGHETVTVPAVQVVKVKKLVTLQSDSLVIVLPSPEFNDSEGGTGRINIKRTMAGGRRVYARDNITSKLNYQFIIDRKKAIELRNFIMNSNTKFLRMENWKGEIWAVQMTNSPFSFGEDAAWLGSPGGNKSSITLEFEGVRLN